MKAHLCFIVIVLSFLTNISGQNVNTRKFGISVSSGLSIPIGSYGKKDPEYSAIYFDRQVIQSIRGFEKSKSGFAKTGIDFNFEINYKITSTLKLLLRTGTFSNSVETKSMSEFVTHVYDDKETKVEEDDYRFLYITPGIKYLYSLGKLDFGADITLGYSRTNFPYYKFVLLFTSVDPPVILAHDGSRPNLGAITVGSSLTTDYKILNQLKVGLSLSYQRSDFRYNLATRSIPGGSTVFLFSDILKVRTLNTALRISYSF